LSFVLALQTVDEVLAVVRAELGEHAALALQAAMAARDEQEQEPEPAEVARRDPGDTLQ
jgi:hypothetical protein